MALPRQNRPASFAYSYSSQTLLPKVPEVSDFVGLIAAGKCEKVESLPCMKMLELLKDSCLFPPSPHEQLCPHVNTASMLATFLHLFSSGMSQL